MTGDFNKLQGSWTVFSVEAESRTMQGGSRIVIDGERFTTIAMGTAARPLWTRKMAAAGR